MKNRNKKGNLTINENARSQVWVIDILKSDDLHLANAKNAGPYGRAKLKPSVKILLWAMRIYVLLSLVLIVAQLFISLKK